MHGVSTRAVGDLVKAAGMSGLSRSQVSRLCAEIDEKVSFPGPPDRGRLAERRRPGTGLRAPFAAGLSTWIQAYLTAAAINLKRLAAARLALLLRCIAPWRPFAVPRSCPA